MCSLGTRVTRGTRGTRVTRVSLDLMHLAIQVQAAAPVVSLLKPI